MFKCLNPTVPKIVRLRDLLTHKRTQPFIVSDVNMMCDIKHGFCMVAAIAACWQMANAKVDDALSEKQAPPVPAN